jgi:ATP-binding protein involved in chromosome partitioning
VPTEREIRKALEKVIDPELKKSLVELDMVKNVSISDSHVLVEIALTVPGCPLKAQIRRQVIEEVSQVKGVSQVKVSLRVMTEVERQKLIGKLGRKQKPPLIISEKTTVIGIASGKGGVGKSTVSVNLAISLSKTGKSVGIMDADIWGFSVPRMIGLKQQPTATDNTIIPPEKDGIKVISIGFFVEEETPIIWRGPLVHRAIEQFLTQVRWGDIDYLVVDLPPGTGDVTISIAKMLPRIKIVMVTTPQPAASKVAARAAHLAQKANLEIVGVIENMSYFSCPKCGEKNFLFGEGGGQLLANQLDVPLLGQIPLDSQIRQGSDTGKPITSLTSKSETAIKLSKIAAALEKAATK